MILTGNKSLSEVEKVKDTDRTALQKKVQHIEINNISRKKKFLSLSRKQENDTLILNLTDYLHRLSYVLLANSIPHSLL